MIEDLLKKIVEDEPEAQKLVDAFLESYEEVEFSEPIVYGFRICRRCGSVCGGGHSMGSHSLWHRNLSFKNFTHGRWVIDHQEVHKTFSEEMIKVVDGMITELEGE